MTTITFNERTKVGKTLLEFAAKNKGVKINGNSVKTDKEKFLKKLKRSAQHAREIGAGIREGNSINALMDEL